MGNLFWVLAYDTEYAMVDRDDDLKIGIRTSAITLGRFDVAGVMAFYAIYLLSWLYLGLKLGLGPVYAVGIVVAALQAAWHFTLIWGRTREGCFRAFRANHWVGAAVFAGVVLSFVPAAIALRWRCTAGRLERPSRRTRRRSAFARACAARKACTMAGFTPAASMAVIAAWVVPPLDVTRERSVSGESSLARASEVAPLNVACARRRPCSGLRPMSAAACIMASRKKNT